MRITLVMASAEDGGLEKHVIELANGLSQSNIVSLIAHSRFEHLVNKNVDFIEMDLSGSRHNPWTKHILRKKILLTQPDIFHVHAAKTAQFVQSMIKTFDFPSVVTVHGHKKNNKMNHMFDHIIVVSEQLKQQFSNMPNVSVVYNGVELSQLPTIFEKNHKFIAVGRLNEVKGFDILLQAWQKIPHEYTLTIAGDGEERAKLEQLIQELNLSNRVSLVGFCSEIQQLISEHEALIVSSLKEGGPYTLGEALLLKRPVIGTCVGMMPEFINDHWLCEPNDVQALQQLIERYCQLEKPSDIFREAFDLAEQNLTIQHMLSNTQAIYLQIISQFHL